MSWPFNRRSVSGESLVRDAKNRRTGGPVARNIRRTDALQHSAVWACLRLRADLVSTMPVDVFRRVDGRQVEVPKPPVLVNPGGARVGLVEWLYSTQFDLDSTGNTFGLITARDRNNLPAVIELVPVTDVTVRVRDGVVSYQIAGKVYEADRVWHERAFTTSGLAVGLSPVAHAAMSLNGYLSAQQFAVEWFGNSAVPASALKNNAKTLDNTEASAVKERFKSSMAAGDVFVHGRDWDFEMIAAKGSEAQFIEERKFGIADACRWFGVPGDMIDAETSTGSITYANITQRNLQLLIMNIGPAIVRREDKFSRDLLERPRYAKLNRSALLAMDVKSRYEAHKTGIDARILAPSEARELEDRPPFTPAQIDEFSTLFPSRTPMQPGSSQ